MTIPAVQRAPPAKPRSAAYAAGGAPAAGKAGKAAAGGGGGKPKRRTALDTLVYDPDAMLPKPVADDARFRLKFCPARDSTAIYSIEIALCCSARN